MSSEFLPPLAHRAVPMCFVEYKRHLTWSLVQLPLALRRSLGYLSRSTCGAFMDILTTAERSAHMSRIRARNTQPEMVVRQAARALGLRYRLHRKDLPGSPDLVFVGRRRAIFVHGCYWHRHPGCRLAYTPKSNVAFWQAKFERNVARDKEAIAALEADGWRTAIIWECETRRPDGIQARLQSFLCEGAA